jgi:hypothetical protein
MNPDLKTVKACDNYTLQLVFENGEEGVYDCSDLVGFGVFQEFKDINYFRQVFVSFGTVAWPNGQDICPDTLYLTATGKEAQLTRGTRYETA